MEQDARFALGICRNIEKLCADIYFYYAEIFPEPEAIRIFWEKTAHEERNHANILQMAEKCRDMELKERRYDLVRYRNFERMVRGIYESVRQSKPTLADALRSSINLERKLEEFHLTCVAEFAHLADANFFTALSRDDRTHVIDMERAYESLLAASRPDRS